MVKGHLTVVVIMGSLELLNPVVIFVLLLLLLFEDYSSVKKLITCLIHMLSSINICEKVNLYPFLI